MAAYKDEARGTWYVSFHYNDWTGKNKRKLKRGFRTRKEALEYEQKFLLQQAINLDMRFEDFYKLYEEDLKPKLKLNTWRTKDVIFQKKLIPYFKDKKMNEISPADIIKWQNEMIKKRQADGKHIHRMWLHQYYYDTYCILHKSISFFSVLSVVIIYISILSIDARILYTSYIIPQEVKLTFLYLFAWVFQR